MKIEEQTLLVISDGEYSDYTFSGPFRVLRAFDQKAISDAYIRQWKPADGWEEEPDTAGFKAWLAVNGYIEDVPSHEWHIGSYG